MRYVIIRDDDTNALTPIDCIERLYRPFLDRNLPVNLAVIPDVATNTTLPDGTPEGFLFAKNGAKDSTMPIGENSALVKYLRDNPGFNVVQHGCHHDYFEFDRAERDDAARRVEQGSQLLMKAGFDRPDTFVAPYDRLSRATYREIARRFRVLSTGWFELRRLPRAWWPRYLAKKIRHEPHWRVNGTILLSHPGCLLSCFRDVNAMLDSVRRTVESNQLTVLVTHWWEYFRNGQPNEPFIRALHDTAGYLASNPAIRVISFSDLARGDVKV